MLIDENVFRVKANITKIEFIKKELVDKI